MAHESLGFIFADASWGSMFVEKSLQISIFTKLKNDIEMLTTTEAVVHFDDERWGDGLEGGYLTFDLFLDVIGQFVDVNDLDGNLLSIFALPEIDWATSSFT